MHFSSKTFFEQQYSETSFFHKTFKCFEAISQILLMQFCNSLSFGFWYTIVGEGEIKDVQFAYFYWKKEFIKSEFWILGLYFWLNPIAIIMNHMKFCIANWQNMKITTLYTALLEFTEMFVKLICNWNCNEFTLY